MRLRGTPVFPRNMVLGCIQDNRLIHAYGREVARQCKQIGAQVNFAPVADVNINPKNPVINTRSFGENPMQVADKVIAYASGLEEGGVLSVCKHFPGHGDTDIDSHKALPVLPFTRERLDSVELYPFKRAIRAGLVTFCQAFFAVFCKLFSDFSVKSFSTFSPFCCGKLFSTRYCGLLGVFPQGRCGGLSYVL